MSIKIKLILLTTLSVFGLLALTLLLYNSINSLNELSKAHSEVELLKADTLMLRRSEKDFFLRKDLKYKKKFDDMVTHVHEVTAELIHHLDEFGFDVSKVEKFDSIIDNYKVKFFMIIEKQQKIGLNHDKGLYGSLRSSVHEIQKIAKNSNDLTLLLSIYDLRKEEKDFMLRRDMQYANHFEKKINILIKSSSDRIKQNLKTYKNDFLVLVKAEKEIGLDSKSSLIGSMRKVVHQTETLLETMENEIEFNLESKINSIKTKSLILASFIIVLVVLIGLLIANNIISSINRFQDGLLGFFNYINKQTSTVVMLKDDSNDEIGIMSKTVNKNIIKSKELIEDDNRFLNEVQMMVEEVNKGYLSHKFKTKVQSENLERLRLSFNEMLENLNNNICSDTNKILEVLESFSKLDFTNSVKNDNGKIALALNAVVKLITEMLVDNKSNGLTLQKSSNILLENVDILNGNSYKTAVALEQTAASLEQITGNIIGNTENIAKMSSYANKLTSSSNKGQKLANKTAVAMDEINEQVTAINDAIGIIDQIAFQTNILSLNAAVEAATAGEAGKGFAVVAQEVRNLATRSSSAAKEIKELVENATNKANEGKNISSEMILGYNSLNQNISSTLDLILGVESASKEQLIGIKQINDAVNELDEQTQQNVTVAITTQKIAQQTDDIATLVVLNADEKEFHGKDNVQQKDFLKKGVV